MASQAAWALFVLPWPESRLGNIFIASVLAAVAAAMAWVAASGRLSSAAGGFLHVATMLGGIGVALLMFGPQAGSTRGNRTALLLLAAALCGSASFAWVRRLPVADRRPLPMSLRVWCALYVCILLPAGTTLIARLPGVMPWSLPALSSMIYGCVFVAAAWSFLLPLLRPQVEHIRVGLIGFLTYDAVRSGRSCAISRRCAPKCAPVSRCT
jgi:drug/metabolite transporter (DMT)-like permease